MPSQLRKLLFMAQLITAMAGTFTLAAGLAWLIHSSWALLPVALLFMGAFQLLFAFVLPRYKVFSTDSEMASFRAWVVLISALIALLAAIGFNYAALRALG